MPVLTPTRNALVYSTNSPEKITQHLPQDSYIVRPGILAVTFTLDMVKLLTNLKLDMSQWQPIDHLYTYPLVKMAYQMYPHAMTTAQRMVMMERGFVLNDPRTGKTSALIAAVDFLQQQGVVNSVLVVAPLSTLVSVWVEEIKGMLPHKSVSVLHSRASGAKRVAHVKKELAKRSHFYVINPDGVKNPKILELLLQAKQSGHLNAMAIDESTQYGNPSTARWRAAAIMAHQMRFFWMMTGTPGGPETVYGQAKMMRPESVPTQKRIWKLRTMVELRQYVWVPRADAEEQIKQVLTPAVRFKKRDVWPDLPNEMVIPYKVELTPKQTKLMKILNDDKGVTISGTEVIPANAAVLASKLVQIASGTMILDSETKDTIRLPVDTRLDMVLQLLAESDQKMIIYTNYRETNKYIRDLLEAKGFSVEVVDGSVSSGKRPAIFSDFEKKKDPHVLVAHAETVAYGVELAAADKIVFWGPPMISPFLYQQAKERLFSSHQKAEQPAIYQLYSTYAERRMFDNLEAGVKWQTNMSDLFKEMI